MGEELGRDEWIDESDPRIVKEIDSHECAMARNRFREMDSYAQVDNLHFLFLYFCLLRDQSICSPGGPEGTEKIARGRKVMRALSSRPIGGQSAIYWEGDIDDVGIYFLQSFISFIRMLW
jgi:hypothetical protein